MKATYEKYTQGVFTCYCKIIKGKALLVQKSKFYASISLVGHKGNYAANLDNQKTITRTEFEKFYKKVLKKLNP